MGTHVESESSRDGSHEPERSKFVLFVSKFNCLTLMLNCCNPEWSVNIENGLKQPNLKS